MRRSGSLAAHAVTSLDGHFDGSRSNSAMSDSYRFDDASSSVITVSDRIRIRDGGGTGGGNGVVNGVGNGVGNSGYDASADHLSEQVARLSAALEATQRENREREEAKQKELDAIRAQVCIGVGG